MAYEMAAMAVTLNDLEGHSRYAIFAIFRSSFFQGHSQVVGSAVFGDLAPPASSFLRPLLFTTLTHWSGA